MNNGELTAMDFYSSIMEEVNLAKESLEYGWELQDAFTSVVLDYLEDIGEVLSPILCPYRGYGLQLNAYSITEDFECVDIIVSSFHDVPSRHTTSLDEVDALLKRGIQVFRKAVNDLYSSFQKDSCTYEFAMTLHKHKGDIKKVRIIALTNGNVRATNLSPLNLDGMEITFSVWDMDRLYRCVSSGKMRETVEIDLEKDFHETIPCIENTTSDKYKVYLAIISGQLLASIYDAYGPRLLEKNVRSFLTVKGDVNKGIRDTLRNEPDMFLAYNNGISVTAESVDVVRDENGKPSIKLIRDMQIVNGGQTTASIHNAMKDKSIGADLTKVFVQMKISVIESSSTADEIVPKISAYANTQNKIQSADFSANDPYHRRIEELSRVIWTPSVNGSIPINWFYERSRGQYANMLSRETTKKRKDDFKATHPLFTKTDLAKFVNAWGQLPYQVCEGAQKNFKKFTLGLAERKDYVPDEVYYHRLIAKAILFKQTEKIVQAQNYGGYRAQIVAYTIAFLSYKTSQTVDLLGIWKNQRLSENLAATIAQISHLVQPVIANPPAGANIGEWSKKEKCWEVISALPFEISLKLKAELVQGNGQVNDVVVHKPKTGVLDDLTDEEQTIIDKVCAIPSSVWFNLSSWAKNTDNFESWQRGILFSVGRIISAKKKPSIKQARQALAAYEKALQIGYKPKD